MENETDPANINLYAICDFFGSCFKNPDIADPRFEPAPLGLQELSQIYQDTADQEETEA